MTTHGWVRRALFGVAPGARLWAVKVLSSNGSGYISWIVAGIDYVTANANSIEVANMSLGCECTSAAMNTAIANSVAAGVVYAVAAGNSDKNASTFSPANHPDVITVSALADFDGAPGGLGSPTCRTDEDDTLADFSNWGSLIEITAPGVCILSTVPGGGYATHSGTSMASPHVAGAAALLASRSDPNSKSDVQAIRSTIVNEVNLTWIDDSGDGTQEPLLDVSNTTAFAPALVAGSGGGSNTAPVASNDSYTATESQTVNVPAPGVLGNDTDANANTLTAVLVTTTLNGSLILNANGSFSYTSITGATSDSFTYKANDGTADSNTAMVSITVNPTSSGGTMHVGDLDGTASLKGKSGKWQATVTVTIHDGTHVAVSNASVTATWSGATSGTVSGTTGSSGTVSFSTGAITGTSVTLTITGVTHASLTYDGSANHESDGDSDGTRITVSKPT